MVKQVKYRGELRMILTHITSDWISLIGWSDQVLLQFRILNDSKKGLIRWPHLLQLGPIRGRRPHTKHYKQGALAANSL